MCHCFTPPPTVWNKYALWQNAEFFLC
jgi:hypothetical protein